MKVDQDVWDFFQQHLGYSDEEAKLFRENPRNEDVLSKGTALMGKTIIFQVVESNGCNSQHRVGDEFRLDGAGNLISKLCPKRMCIYPVSSMAAMVMAVNEMFYAGTDPNEMRFKRFGCHDVGVRCGGWGHIVLEMRVEDRPGAAAT
jgi:uncharacterized repeat protein (TIGR04076 family)